MSDDLISRRALKKQLETMVENCKTLKLWAGSIGQRVADIAEKVLALCIRAVDEAAAVDAVPVVHGRWVKHGHYPPECSVCGGIAPKDCEGEEFYQSDFCQSCGADMRERAVEGAGPYKEQNEMDRRRAWIKLQGRCPSRVILEDVKTGEQSVLCHEEHDEVETQAPNRFCNMKSCPGLEEFMEAVIMGVEE